MSGKDLDKLVEKLIKIKNLGRKTARDMTEKFGIDAYDVLVNDPVKLLSIYGMTPHKINTILMNIKNGLIDNSTKPEYVFDKELFQLVEKK